MTRAPARLDALIFDEVDRRRAADSDGEDVLSMLVAATDEDGGDCRREQCATRS